MKFADHIAPMSKLKKAKLLSEWAQCTILLSTTGPQRQFLLNFELECRLCQAAWTDIQNVIESGITDAAQLQKLLTNVFRNYLLRGATISSPVPKPLGRAVTKDVYIELLRDQFGFNTEDELNQFLDDLLGAKATLASIRKRLRRRLLAKKGRIMWATFDILPDGSLTGQNPFDKMDNHANGIRAQLGLISNKEEKRKDLLLFVYNLPDDIDAYFPTLAEAYAGDEWLWYFRPAVEADSYGRTMPWPDTEYLSSPEVVHEPITGNNLVEKIKVAKVRGRR
jgi:hypothetical protein